MDSYVIISTAKYLLSDLHYVQKRAILFIGDLKFRFDAEWNMKERLTHC